MMVTVMSGCLDVEGSGFASDEGMSGLASE